MTDFPRTEPKGQIPLAILVPVMNEARSLGSVLDRILETMPVGSEVFVINDGSTDESALIASERGVHVIRHAKRCGYGAALKTGLRHTEKIHIGIVDADSSYDPADLDRLCSSLPLRGMAVGTRSHEPSWIRRLAKRGFLRAVRMFTKQQLPDLNSGLRVFHRTLVDQLAHVLPDRFSFTTTLTLGAFALSVPVTFVPIQFRKRVGTSKFTLGDVFLFAKTVFRGCTWIRDRARLERPTA